ncbi:hypothetical protein TWF696_005523 [Orbilia brochopaga]|uniref:Uncharacterized protein n=1 Tax=Orbilia brochopaga TaxID=3140254 RepID=A0AAV9V129_9PEZI
MKLWQVIKMKRDQREEERRQMQADIEAMESENGRRVEESAQRDREAWEKQYGDKSSATLVDGTDPDKSQDSGNGKESSDEIRGLDGMEPAELDATQTPGHKEPPEPKLFAPAVVIREKGDVEESPAESATPPDPQAAAAGIAAPTAVHTVIIDSSEKEDDDDASSLATFADSVVDDKRKSVAFSTASGPDGGPREIPHDDAASSVAGVLDDEEDDRSETELPLVGDDAKRRSMMSLKSRRHSWTSGKRTSIISLGRRASLRSMKSIRNLASGQQSPTAESPQLPEFRFSLADLPSGEKHGEGSKPGASAHDLLSPPEGDETTKLLSSNAGDSVAVEPTEAGEPADKATDGQQPSRHSSTHSSRPGDGSGESSDGPKSRKERKSTDSLPTPLRHGSLQHVRPPSRIVKTYRVSEWAKHLDPSEEPQYDDLEPLETPEVVTQEKPVPVHVTDLQEGTSGTKVPPPIQGLEKSASEALNSYVQSAKNNSVVSLQQVQAPMHVSTRQPPPMPIQIPTNMPTSPINGPSSPQIPTVVVGSPHLSRRASQLPLKSPILSQPLVESPVEDAEANASQPTPEGSTESLQAGPSIPLPPASETLLTKRESMLKAPPNFSPISPIDPGYMQAFTQPPQHFQTISPNASSSSLNNTLNMGNLHLANNRRSATPTSLIQQRSSSGTNYAGSVVSGITPSSRVPSMEGPQLLPQMNFSPFMSQAGAGIPIPVPHGAVETAPLVPPPPAAGERRETMLRAWRESLMQDQVISARTHNSIQDRRNMMIQEHVMMNAYGKQREYEKGMWEGMVDERYKHQNMLAMHREHLKKMQEKAKGIQ